MLFYDFEVFLHDWLVVIIDMENKKEYVIVNDPAALEKIYQENVNNIWVSYNGVWYDQYIMKAILCGFDPKKVNDFIIVQKKDGYKFSSMFKNISMINFDVMLGTDRGLKSFEGFMGNNIKETGVDFNIPRKLTQAEIEETIKYCRHDVQQTIEVFLRRVDEFNTKMFFIKHFGFPLSDLSKTKPQLAAKILGGNYKGKMFDDEFQFPILDCLDLKKYKFVADWYRNPDNHTYSKKQDKVIVAGVEHTFSWGGGHGARRKYHAVGDFLIIDVTAYYPTLQEKYKFGYRVMNHPENFEFIHNSNVEFKRMGDKKKRQPFKIMDNAISGQMKMKGSALYDPMSNNSICVNGQLLLLDLIEHLEPYCELVQNNTDGIIIRLYNYDRDFDIIDKVVAEWEQRTGTKMDFDTFFGEIFQGDVNNYLIVDRENGAVKSKGLYVKKLSELDYDLPILNKALVDYMIDGVPVEKTINDCDDLKEFQMVAKIGGKYKHLVHGDKVLKEKCIRVFASKNPNAGGLTKVSIRTGKPEKVASSPEHCFIYNEEVNGVSVPDELDKNWYIHAANKRLKDKFGL